ncbi:F0F1 ATP synthase subunit B [Serpentinicella sp. ANB-PHB4]|uniref:F0F1 ATP synthase subunit B n=1 Tax=Serpentinicella sp. ANB-PHB4 TaxID=3074076 RepID=UPI00285B51A6|nr:F0F1 ATP synthase subunit B [Serpentinicella sp. ANB-PHB4]MDR5659715.1 F0F1 ATP synthase subunit B [Serpentinicella sp. ANB-PHB4]
MGSMGLVEFGWTFFFTIINFLIIYAILKRLLFKPVTEFMENRTKGIENALTEAKVKNEEADQVKAEYTAKLENIKEERNQMIKEATKKADERSNEIIKEAQDEAQKIMDRAMRDIERERQKAANLLKDEISGLSILAATKVIEKEIDEQSHHALIKEFIEEVGEEQWLN